MESKYFPEIKTENQYREYFAQNDIWLKPVQYLADQNNLIGTPVRGIRGSHIVYRVGDHWIKIMVPQFAKDMAYEIAGLECVANKLRIDPSIRIEIPKIIAQGQLENWLYVVLTHVKGERIGDVWPTCSVDAKIALAKQIAEVTLSLQQCEANAVVKQRGEWNAFIKERFKNMVAHHRMKKMDEAWLAALPAFLEKFEQNAFLTDQPVFLHADLTWDHFLVDKSGGKPNITAVIDFADCRVGHPEYDLPAILAFILKGEAKPLREFLLAFGYKESDLNSGLSEKLMVWSCLHQFADVRNYYTKEMAQVSSGDFAALARLVYPLEGK